MDTLLSCPSASELFQSENPPSTPARTRGAGAGAESAPLWATAEAETATLEEAPKRRRLSLKQCSPVYPRSAQPLASTGSAGGDSRAEGAAAGVADSVAALPESVYYGPLSRRDYKVFHQRLSRWQQQKQGLGDSETSPGAARHLFAQDRAGKLALVQAWAEEDTRADPALREHAVGWFAELAALNKTGDWLHKQQALLTWNGDWGVFPLSLIQSAWLDVDSACAALRETPELRALAADVQAAMRVWEMKYHTVATAWSLELSTSTYESLRARARDVEAVPLRGTQAAHASELGRPCVEPLAIAGAPSAHDEELENAPLRVHLHAFFRFAKAVHVRSSDAFLFKGSHPNLSSVTTSASGRQRAVGNQGLYYVQAPKFGSILTGGSTAPFTGYMVNPDWVYNLLQGQKLSVQSARQEFVAIGKNLPRNVEVLDRIEQEREKGQVLAVVASVQAELRGRAAQMVEIPAVTEWVASFAETNWRYKFLVLDGPSRTGNTVFCRSLSPDPDRFLEVDCAGVLDPALKEFKNLYHEFVLFDEASVLLVLKNKKLFQASASWVVCGSSSTNMYAYKIWAHRVKLMVASNRWQEELARLPLADAQWLVQNSVYVRGSGPLWQTPVELLAHTCELPATPSVLSML